MSNTLARLTCLLGLFSSTVFAVNHDWKFSPNFGADVGAQHVNFEQGFGAGHFSEHYPATNVYAGAYLSRFLGVEVGYENMYRQAKKQFYPSKTIPLGFIPSTFISQQLYLSNLAMHGWHTDVVGIWPVCPRTKTELTASAGISWLKMLANTTVIQESSFGDNPANPVVYWNSGTHAVPRLGLGLRQMINCHFGIRLQGIWQDTSKLTPKVSVPPAHIAGGGPPINFIVAAPLVHLNAGNAGASADSYTIKPKDTYQVNVGFFYQY